MNTLFKSTKQASWLKHNKPDVYYSRVNKAKPVKFKTKKKKVVKRRRIV